MENFAGITETDRRFPLTIDVVSSVELTEEQKRGIVALCTRAFNKDFTTLAHFEDEAVHVLARIGSRVVGHAVWTTRWFELEGGHPLRTAYVDAVAADPDLQHRGIGSAVMRRLAAETQEFELRALATASVSFYRRLGWESWVGPRAVRKNGTIVPTPNEGIMVMRTSRSPVYDVNHLLVADWRDGLLF